jgi:HK97 gp10 family phage protein
MARFKLPPIRADKEMQGRTFSSITGLGDVKSLLAALLKEVPEEYEKVLNKYCDIIENSAKAKITHEVTGKLKKSFKIKRVFTEKKKRVTIVAGGNVAPHAHLVEFGHRLVSHSGEIIGAVPGKHFMRDAFTENIPALTAEIEEILAEL